VATGKRLVTSDLTVHFLSQAKAGPFRTRAEVLRTTEDTALTRVEVLDGGSDDRVITVMMNTATLEGVRST
jgi:acyl-coenzyme A thioesterase PaaI-like protein